MQEIMQKIKIQNNGNCTNYDSCPVCHGSGFEFIFEKSDTGTLYKAVRPCSACRGVHAEKVRNAKALAEIPEERTISDFDWDIYSKADLRREKARIEKFIDEFPAFEAHGWGLYITSRTKGSGKTFLASCIAGEIINRYEASTAFVNASELLDISQKRNDNFDPIEKLISCRLLILDDLGQKLTGKDWLTDILFRIIDKRYQKKRIMIITSNDLPSELDFDDRIVDRINRTIVPIQLPEECIRAREANYQRKEFLKSLGID